MQLAGGLDYAYDTKTLVKFQVMGLQLTQNIFNFLLVDSYPFRDSEYQPFSVYQTSFFRKSNQLRFELESYGPIIKRILVFRNGKCLVGRKDLYLSP